MSDRLQLSLWFGLGVALQAVLLIRHSWDWKKFGCCAGAGLFGMLPGKNERHYEPFLHILFSFGIFAVMVANFFRKEILPRIDERILFSYTLTFWFAFLKFFYRNTTFDNMIAAILLIPTAGAVFLAFSRVELKFVWKWLFYAWFICLVIMLGLFQFSYGNLSFFFKNIGISRLSVWECALTGMVFLYLVVNAAYILELIPMKGRNQSWKDRMKEWHELTSLMANRYGNYQLTLTGALSILVLQGGFLFLEYNYHLISDNLLINLLILLPMAITFADSGLTTEG